MVWTRNTTNKNRDLPWEETDMRQVEHYISYVLSTVGPQKRAQLVMSAELREGFKEGVTFVLGIEE